MNEKRALLSAQPDAEYRLVTQGEQRGTYTPVQFRPCTAPEE